MKGDSILEVLIIISSDDAEIIYNAARLANTGVEKGDEVSMFMLGKGLLSLVVIDQVRQNGSQTRQDSYITRKMFD